MTTEKMFTPNEVAAMIGVSARTIKRRCQDGEIEGAFRTSDTRTGHWKIPASSVDAYLKKIGYKK